jgi:hypothetical protein
MAEYLWATEHEKQGYVKVFELALGHLLQYGHKREGSLSTKDCGPYCVQLMLTHIAYHHGVTLGSPWRVLEYLKRQGEFRDLSLMPGDSVGVWNDSHYSSKGRVAELYTRCIKFLKDSPEVFTIPSGFQW